MNFEFSLIGFLFLIMLLVPNMIWTRFQPKDYELYSKNENRILLALERIGEVFVSVFALFCGARFSFSALLLISFVLMILYEIYWFKYFKSSLTMEVMYGDFLGIPLPGAVLPVLAFLVIGLYSKNILLLISTLILAIGHIGIHFNHKKEIDD